MKNLRILVGVLLLLPLTFGFAQFEIKIDAEKDAYYNTLTGPSDGWIWMPSDVFNNNGPQPDGDEDLSANIYSAWDSTYFYIYENVTDDIVNQNNATNYQNDCLEIKIDPDPYSDDGVVWATRLTCLDSTDADESVFNGIDNCYTEAWSISDKVVLTYEDFARKLTDTGYALELRLKWEWIATMNKGPVWPEAGNMFGLAYMNHDNDNTGRDGSIEWAAVLQDQVWNDAKLHGTVEFLADHKLKYSPENLKEPANFYENPDIFIPPAGSGVSRKSAAVERFELAQNYPNPFNPRTTIRFSIPKARHVTLKVYDVLGCEVATLINGTEPAGTQAVEFDGSALPSGIYYYRIEAGPFSAFKKLTLIK